MKLSDLNAVWLIKEYIKQCCMPVLLEVSTGEVAWPKSWSDDLFSPPKSFEARRAARKFLTWAASNGVDVDPWLNALQDQQSIPSPPKALEGYVGRAYIIGDKVIKFTTDKREAMHADLLKGHDDDFVATVYDVRKVGGGTSNTGSAKDLYALIQQKVNTGVGKKFRIAGGAVYDFIDRNSDIANLSADSVIATLPPKYRNDDAIVMAIHKVVSATKSLLAKHHIKYADMHGANLGFKGKNVSFFDLGRSYSDAERKLATL